MEVQNTNQGLVLTDSPLAQQKQDHLVPNVLEDSCESNRS